MNFNSIMLWAHSLGCIDNFTTVDESYNNDCDVCPQFSAGL